MEFKEKMKLNDFISEYYEMIDNPNEVLEFFKIASDYLSPDNFNKLCKMLQDAGVKFDWQGIINKTNYITDYKEIPSSIDNSLKLDSFVNDNFKSTLVSINISQLNITFNELNDILHNKIFSTTADINGEIEDAKVIVDRFYFTFITDSYWPNIDLCIFFVDKQRSSYININLPINGEQSDMGADIISVIPHQVLLYNENNIKKLIKKYETRVTELLKEILDNNKK